MSEPLKTIKRQKQLFKAKKKGDKTATRQALSEIENVMKRESEIQKVLNPFPQYQSISAVLRNELERVSVIEKMLNPPALEEAVKLQRRFDEWKMMFWEHDFNAGDDLALIQAFLFASPELPEWVDSGMRDRFGRYMEKNIAGGNRKLDEFFKIPQERFKSFRYEDEMDDYCYLKYHWKLSNTVIFRVLDLKYPPQTGVMKEARGKADRWRDRGGKAYFEERKAVWDKNESYVTQSDIDEFLATFPKAARVMIKDECKGKYPVIVK